jgi:hypothetical protein
MLSLLEGYGANEAEAMEAKPVPRAEDWRDKYLAWIDRGELPPDRSEARRIARMAKSVTMVDGELNKRAASGVLQQCIPIPHDRGLFETSTQVYVATMRRLAHSWVTRSAKACIGPQRSLMPTRSCAPVRGASSMPVGLISRLTTNNSRHMALRRVGARHRRALAKGARGLHPPAGHRG